jgi:hypothetical protein
MNQLKDLKEYLNSLTEDQLEQKSLILGDMDSGFSGGPISISIFDEDHWYSEDGSFPKSSITEKEFEDYKEYYGKEARVVIPAGSIFFHLMDQ